MLQRLSLDQGKQGQKNRFISPLQTSRIEGKGGTPALFVKVLYYGGLGLLLGTPKIMTRSNIFLLTEITISGHIKKSNIL